MESQNASGLFTCGGWQRWVPFSKACTTSRTCGPNGVHVKCSAVCRVESIEHHRISRCHEVVTVKKIWSNTMSYVLSSWMFVPQSSTCCEVLAYNRAEEQLLGQNMSKQLFHEITVCISDVSFFSASRFLIQWWCTGRQKRVTGLQLRFESETEVPQGPKWFGEVVRSDAIWWHVMACNQLGVTIWSTNPKRCKLI